MKKLIINYQYFMHRVRNIGSKAHRGLSPAGRLNRLDGNPPDQKAKRRASRGVSP
jgi:hypothetical protein